MARKAIWDDVPEARRAVMRAVKGKDTKPEMAVRRLVHGLGTRRPYPRAIKRRSQ